jgi:hypothetical protein
MKIKGTVCFIVFLILLSVFTLGDKNIEAEEEIQVELKVKGESVGVRPDIDLATVELSFKDLEEGIAFIHLKSPEENFFSPTDFPIVEGTDLIDTSISIEGGKATFDYMFPIRGKYLLDIVLQDHTGTQVGQHKLDLTIKENPKEIQNAIIFIIILVLFGFIVGYMFTKRRGNRYAA